MLEPVLHLERRDGSPEYEVRIESLPVRLGALGTVDLATAIPPIPVQRVSEMLLESRQTSIPLQLEILSIDVGPEGIGIGVRTRYRGEFLSAAPSSGATGRPSD